MLTVKDPLNRVTTNQYDALNRLKQVTSTRADLGRHAIRLQRLGRARPKSPIRAAWSPATRWMALATSTSQSSPDTGTTTNTYDAAGNLLTQTDAKSQITTYAYDALNRVTLITFHDGSKQIYVYDQGANGIGRLSSITETNPANQVTSVIAYAYDQHGRVLSETRTVNSVPYALGYRYDAFGRLDQLTYPSGRTVNYTFDCARTRKRRHHDARPALRSKPWFRTSPTTHLAALRATRSATDSAYTRGIRPGRPHRVLHAGHPGLRHRLRRREPHRSSSPMSERRRTPTPTATTISTDSRPRCYRQHPTRTPTTLSATVALALPVRSTENYDYSSTSNRIASITPPTGPVRNFVFDPNGSTTADGNNTYVYDVRGRMAQATSSIGATNYQVNALGQRIRKTNSQADRVFHYDTRGRLIAETDPGGALKRELIYLGDIPVGVVQ